jgi:hypothetical protein
MVEPGTATAKNDKQFFRLFNLAYDSVQIEAYSPVKRTGTIIIFLSYFALIWT